MTTVTMRDRFIEVTEHALGERPDLAVVLADISAAQFREVGAFDRYEGRVVNVGIREQLQVSFAAGLAKEGFRPVIHTYAPFLIERPYEQIKLDFGHQGLNGIFVSVGGSFDSSTSGRTHHAPEDVALMSTIPGMDIFVPGHADEAGKLLAAAIDSDGSVYIRLSEESNQSARAVSPGVMSVERQGSPGSPVVVAVGPRLDATIEAVADHDVTLLYATSIHPFDTGTLQDLSPENVVLIEPYLEGTGAIAISASLSEVPHRLLSIGVKRTELRRYGTIADHVAAHELDAAGLRRRIGEFLGW